MTKILKKEDCTDVELISHYKNGEEVMGELYGRYKNLVYGSCLKYFKNRTDADDAVAEIFVLLSKKLKTHEVTHFKSWLYTLTRNYCIEVLRKTNRRRDKKNTAESMYSEVVFHPDDIRDEKMLANLDDCIEALPPNQKKTIMSFYFEKIDYKTIAKSMDVSWNTVRSWMQNGRRNIKNCLENK